MSLPEADQDPSDDVCIGGATEGLTGQEHASDKLVNGYGSSGQRVANPTTRNIAADYDVMGTTVKGIRLGAKSAGCAFCSGPCGGLKCYRDEAGSSEAMDDSPDEAADALRAAVARLKASRDNVTPVLDPVGVKRRFDNVRRTEPKFDGRTKRAKAIHLLPRNFGMVPAWLLGDPKIGNVAIHATHVPHLGWYRGVTWCWKCGSFAIAVPSLLRRECTKPGTHGNLQLARLRKGQTPRNEVPWPLDEA